MAAVEWAKQAQKDLIFLISRTAIYKISLGNDNSLHSKNLRQFQDQFLTTLSIIYCKTRVYYVMNETP